MSIFKKCVTSLRFGFVRQKEKLAKGNKISEKSHFALAPWKSLKHDDSITATFILVG